MPSGSTFEIAHAESFPLDLGNAPKKVRNAYRSVVLPLLRQSPNQSNPPQIKKLKGWKQRWRMRVSDNYRLVYSIIMEEQCVILEMLDHRAKIYSRLGANEDDEYHPPTTRIVANAEYLLEREPTPEEIGNAEIVEAEAEHDRIAPEANKELPEPLCNKNLEAWGVPERYREAFIAVKTESELLTLSGTIPEKELGRVLNGLWPPTIEAVSQQPVRLMGDTSDLTSDENKLISLESFLLKLDDKQQEFVKRFEGHRPSGPWLLRGGPGSGKSTMALYCIRALVRSANAELQLDNRPLKILLTTYTNALINASRHLLKTLGVERGNHRIEIKSLYQLASPFVTNRLDVIKDDKILPYIQAALDEFRGKNGSVDATIADAKFLEKEFIWVIIGQGLTKIEDYLNDADRSGRGGNLGNRQREQVWKLFEKSIRMMREDKSWTYPERMQEATTNVRPSYDYVFIDEAQDLTPGAIRFCIGLCRTPGGVFVTADTNQSIYGNGLSWKQVDEDLQFQGRRTSVLRRNYRTTKELWKALSCLAPQGNRADKVALEVEAVYRGPTPILAWYSDERVIADRLNTFLHDALIKERVGPGSAAILCPTTEEMKAVKNLIDARFKPKMMWSKDMNLEHPGVKITTMHAAKGLQFPVVAVFGLIEGRFPMLRKDGIDKDEDLAREQRLLFVACSRAMRRLIVFADRQRPSSLISGIENDHWEIEEL